MSEKENSVVKTLDDEDRLHLENYFLKQQLEQSQIQSEEIRRKMTTVTMAREKELIDVYFKNKYQVNLNTHDISIDDNTITITEKSL